MIFKIDLKTKYLNPFQKYLAMYLAMFVSVFVSHLMYNIWFTVKDYKCLLNNNEAGFTI